MPLVQTLEFEHPEEKVQLLVLLYEEIAEAAASNKKKDEIEIKYTALMLRYLLHLCIVTDKSWVLPYLCNELGARPNDLNYCYDFNNLDQGMCNALHYSISMQSTECVRVLIQDCGADFAIMDSKGRSILQICNDFILDPTKKEEMLKLFKTSFLLHSDFVSLTPAELALYHEIVNSIKKGVDIKIETKYDQPMLNKILLHAIYEGQSKLIPVLNRLGANLNKSQDVKLIFGLFSGSPLAHALMMGNAYVILAILNADTKYHTIIEQLPMIKRYIDHEGICVEERGKIEKVLNHKFGISREMMEKFIKEHFIQPVIAHVNKMREKKETGPVSLKSAEIAPIVLTENEMKLYKKHQSVSVIVSELCGIYDVIDELLSSKDYIPNKETRSVYVDWSVMSAELNKFIKDQNTKKPQSIKSSKESSEVIRFNREMNILNERISKLNNEISRLKKFLVRITRLKTQKNSRSVRVSDQSVKPDIGLEMLNECLTMPKEALLEKYYMQSLHSESAFMRFFPIRTAPQKLIAHDHKQEQKSKGKRL